MLNLWGCFRGNDCEVVEYTEISFSEQPSGLEVAKVVVRVNCLKWAGINWAEIWGF